MIKIIKKFRQPVFQFIFRRLFNIYTCMLECMCVNMSQYMEENRDIGPAVRVFANGPGDLGSIPGRVIPKT